MQGFDRQAAVRFENVEKNFGDVKVLRNFDLEVQPGEFVVLLGASGSGKTTALRILSGLEKPSGGQVYICLLYTSPSPRDRTRSRMPSSA